MNDILERIVHTITTLENSNKLESLVAEALDKNLPPTEILERGVRVGLAQIGEKYEAREYFLSELIAGASMVQDAVKMLAPHLKGKGQSRGTIVLGTVRGDLHDIGKNIFGVVAQGAGFEVDDLGVDVEPERFVKVVQERRPHVLGLSALLTTTIPEMKVVINGISKAGIRNDVRVVLGGNAVTEKFGNEIGADAVALEAVDGVNICRGWTSK